ncbi:hypothetical protein [Metabacillus arenae]|uniref:Uncharacterized protein n=1 Tax=Metabacillus arenae TaxID=2771434 RepID=A0A926RYI1_9BACI|nr:hypothetical protein [Metabacillus arenae]MBD1381770.1 hypothetical protein [Metabacillus arenae]
MKVIGAFVLIFLLSISLSLAMDILLGFKFSRAATHLLNPFWVMDAGENVMLLFFLLITIAQLIFVIKKNKTNKQKGSS